MAYGLKYTGYKQRGTDRVTVNIYAKDWTGTTYELATLTGLSLQIQGAQGTPYSPLIKTSVAIALRDAFDEGSTASDGTTCIKNGGKWGQWEEFYTNDSTKFRVELLHGSTVIWKGYITPDSWGEDMTYRGVINLTARDMLGALSEKEFDLTGAVSIRDIVEGAMTVGEIPMAVSFDDDECPINSNDENILDATVQASVFGGKSWQEALERTLESTGLVLRYDGQGGFYVTSLRYAYSHATATVTPQFTGGSGYRSLDPAARQIVDVFDPKFENYESKDADSTRFLIQTGTYDQTYRAGSQTVTYHSLRKYQVSADTDGNGWRGDLATLPTVSITGRPGLNLCIPTDCDNTGYIEYRDSALRLPMAVTVDAMLVETGTTWSIVQGSAYSVKAISLQIRATVSGQTRYLADTGAWSTVENTLSVAAKEKIIIPELAGATNLAVRIIKVETECAVLPYNALVAAPVLTFSAPEYTDLAGEYKTTTIYNESNHIEINRKPEIGSANTTLAPVIASNILAFDGVVAPDEWGFSDMNGHYPLAVLVQAQLLVLYAAQNGNSIFTGSFIQSDKRTALPGKAYTYYQRSCAMLAGTFDFISGTAQSVTLREIAQWSDIWDTFDPDWTQRESAQAGGTAASGGGTSGGGGGQGGGGGLTPAQKTLLANLDSWFGQDSDGNIFVKKDSEGNERNFYSFGEITAGGIGSDTPVATTTLGGLLNVTDSADDIQTADKILVRRANASGGNSWTLANLSDISGTVVGVRMNGEIKNPGTDKIVDLGTVLTEHQSLAAYRTATAQDIIDEAILEAIPTKLSDLSGDITHRIVTDSQITAWDDAASKAHEHANKTSVLDKLKWDATNNAIYIGDEDNPINFYAYGEVAAGGVGTGGGGGVNYLYMLEDVPDYRTSYRGKYLRAKSDGSGVEWVDVQGGVTSFNSRTGPVTLTLADVESVLNLTPIENAIKSLQSQIDSVSARDGFDELIAASLFADILVGTNIYGTLHGNADSATNANYANGAGNADTVDSEHASAFAHRATWNNLIHSGNEFTYASAGYNGVIWHNYRTASGSTDGNITDYYFGNGKGGSLVALSTLISQSSHGETAYNDLATVSKALQSLQSQVDSVASRDNADFEVLEGVVNECFRSIQSQIDSIATKTDMSEINAVSVHADNLSAVDIWASGNILAYGEVTAGQSSDSRFKDKQSDIRNVDWVLKSLRPMEFDWNDLYHSLGGRNEGHDVGFIAQQVQSLIPSAIGKVYGDYLRLDYNKVTPYLVAGWQSHETRIEYLERRVNELERQLIINS